MHELFSLIICEGFEQLESSCLHPLRFSFPGLKPQRGFVDARMWTARNRPAYSSRAFFSGGRLVCFFLTLGRYNLARERQEAFPVVVQVSAGELHACWGHTRSLFWANAREGDVYALALVKMYRNIYG